MADQTSSRKKFLNRDDILLAARYLFCIPLAWATPERWWPAIARTCTGLHAPFRRHSDHETASGIRSIFGARALPVSAEALRQRHHTMDLIESMQHLRCHRPGGWNPRTEIVGSAHLDHALETGKGAVLWVSDFIYSTLVTKIAIHRAGYNVTHLSRPDHPHSNSIVGRRFLNRILTRLEERYVEERVLVDDGRTTAGMRTLLRRLKANGIVSITIGNEARQTVPVKILDGTIHLAKGAPKLALASGAPLLPVFTLLRDDNSFETTVGAPLEFARDGAADEVAEQAMKSYAERLEPFLLEAPHLWYDWTELITPADQP